MNKKHIFIFVTFFAVFDLEMTFVTDKLERVPSLNLENEKLHILILHLLQLSDYN